MGIEEDGIILYRVYIPKTTEIVTTSDVKFHGVGSVPPEMVTPELRGRTDQLSTPRHPETLGDSSGIREDGALDSNYDMPFLDVKDFPYYNSMMKTD